MTTQEFSNEFDILYNNITSNLAPGLDEYEKSVFLTKAQDEIIKSYFSPKGNKFQEGFDGSEKRQYDFSNLIRVCSLFNVNYVKERITALEKIDSRSFVFLFPEDYFLSVNEIILDNTKSYSVIPLAYNEYQKLMLKPYALPVKRGAWRLFTDKKNCNYVKEYIAGTQCDYSLLSTWADLKRNLKVTIKVTEGAVQSTFVVDNNNVQFSSVLLGGPVKIYCLSGWNSNNKTYEIVLNIVSSTDDYSKIDDETAINIIKEGFLLLKTEKDPATNIPYIEKNYNVSNAAIYTDCFIQASAPSKFENFKTTESSVVVGKTFITNVIQLPIAEVIGKFFSDVIYQIRYVKIPKPIILEDLTDPNLSIRGIKTISECELSSEIHSEILQRAVELAKAAYIGDLLSLIALGQTSETNIGVVAQQR